MEEDEFKVELKSWFAIAGPLALTLLCRTGMVFTDIAVLGKWDSDFLGAAGLAGVWTNLTSVIIWRGFLETLNTLCGQAFGAKSYVLMGHWLRVGVEISMGLTVLCALTWAYAGSILQPLADLDSLETERVTLFCRISVVGLFPFVLYVGLSNFIGASGVVKPLLYINFFSLLLNLLLNLVLVQGWGDVVGLGYSGSAWATSLTRIAVLIFTVAWIHYQLANLALKEAWNSAWCVGMQHQRRRLYREFCGLAIPIAISSLLEEMQIQVVGVLAARIGDKEMATHNAVLQIFFVSSSFLWASSSATQVRMSNHLGAGNVHKARIHMKIGETCALGMGTIVALGFVLGREKLAYLFSNDEDEEIRRLTGEIAVLVGLGYLGLSLFYVSMAVLSAQARVEFIALAFFVGAWGVGVPSAILFAFYVEKTKGLFGLWLGLTCGYFVVTLISVYGVYTSEWDQLAREAMQRSCRERLLLNEDESESARVDLLSTGGGA